MRGGDLLVRPLIRLSSVDVPLPDVPLMATSSPAALSTDLNQRGNGPTAVL
jgi:hypothetical protein